ncbi:ComF family protein [Swaminathania salitolerans]|uniref:Amidophosphoribosyltransferase n=1 Tax=Swaminathania salitolerans TaxID=182838 RepID=A0A511BP61_9PROT|nr:ComF family protein [Swaminathania salitolerans]GBQ10656.1 competence protein F [Swaminathania salitolerans LMG 21291]GEL02121.1 amidophosphoribosyltransferase [Swaminathania salitolerans]
MRGGSLSVARRTARHALDLFFPPVCLSCGGETSRDGLVCVDCFRGLHALISACRICALPLPAPGFADSEGRCGVCAGQTFPWKQAAAAFLYEETARELLLRMKYGDRPDIARFFAGGMMHCAPDLIGRADMLVPVPLHRTRFWRRRYNQSALLCREIARARRMSEKGEANASLHVIPDLLSRHRATGTLATLTPDQRQKTLQGAFHVTPRHRAVVTGRAILLIDDILTTGATASICADLLLRAGARRVDLLVAARTVRLAESFESSVHE